LITSFLNIKEGTIPATIWRVAVTPAINLRPALYLLNGLKKGILCTPRKGLVELRLGWSSGPVPSN